jgi:pimeloyl-ACP methyl ester carboxylesterase
MDSLRTGRSLTPQKRPSLGDSAARNEFGGRQIRAREQPYSDPAPKPEIMADVVSDLHAALQAADVPGPYVLVGHSSGGFEARVFAQKWPGEVAGMVLLDTSYAGQVLDQTNMRSFKGLGFEGEGPAALKCALLAELFHRRL